MNRKTVNPKYLKLFVKKIKLKPSKYFDVTKQQQEQQQWKDYKTIEMNVNDYY